MNTLLSLSVGNGESLVQREALPQEPEPSGFQLLYSIPDAHRAKSATTEHVMVLDFISVFLSLRVWFF